MPATRPPLHHLAIRSARRLLFPHPRPAAQTSLAGRPEEDATAMSGNGTPEIDPILDAAAELFEELGYDETTIDAVAERSGYARSTVFRRYPTKAGLLRAVVEAFLATFPAFVESHFDQPAAPAAAVPTDSPPAAPGKSPQPPPAPARPQPPPRPPVLGPPAGVVIHAFDAYSARHGALARIALAAKDLPWCRPRDCSAEPAWRALAERCFGCPADPQACRLLLDALKHIAHGCDGCTPATATALARTLADLGTLARPRRPSARPPRRPS